MNSVSESFYRAGLLELVAAVGKLAVACTPAIEALNSLGRELAETFYAEIPYLISLRVSECTVEWNTDSACQNSKEENWGSTYPGAIHQPP